MPALQQQPAATGDPPDPLSVPQPLPPIHQSGDPPNVNKALAAASEAFMPSVMGATTLASKTSTGVFTTLIICTIVGSLLIVALGIYCMWKRATSKGEEKETGSYTEYKQDPPDETTPLAPPLLRTPTQEQPKSAAPPAAAAPAPAPMPMTPPMPTPSPKPPRPTPGSTASDFALAD